MSRSNYTEDLEPLEMGRWSGAVWSAIRGKRGQSMLRELFSALNRMPVKELAANKLETADGHVCALGALGKKRKLDMSTIDYEDPEDVAFAFGIPRALAAEIENENDDGGPYGETPAERWVRMRKWVRARLVRNRKTP